MLILTEPTPNPDALKFLVELPGAPEAWALERGQAQTAGSPLAARLFAIAGVSRCLIAATFVSVQRGPGAPPWSQLKYEVLHALAEHLASGDPVLVGALATQPSDGDGPEREIREVLRAHVRPGVARDGGDVVFERFEPQTGVLWIRMLGACGGCPSARMTLKAGVEQIVRRYVPEVLRVEEEGDAEARPGVGERLRRMVEQLGERPARAPRTLFTRNGRPR